MTGTPTEIYMEHRRNWRQENPRDSDQPDRWEARRELIPLALTIADLTEAKVHETGATVGWSDPDVPENVSQEPEDRQTVWSSEYVRQHMSGVAGVLRKVGEALDAVDSTRLDRAYFERFNETTPADTVMYGLNTILRNDRGKALRSFGLTVKILDFLEYRYLEVDSKGGSQRLLMVKPDDPWDWASKSLSQGIQAYCEVDMYRHDKATRTVRECRHRNARGLPPDHWGW